MPGGIKFDEIPIISSLNNTEDKIHVYENKLTDISINSFNLNYFIFNCIR